MFSWIVSSKKDPEIPEEEIEEVAVVVPRIQSHFIPRPPEPDMEVALRIRKKRYISPYHPDDLNEEIVEGYLEREARILEKENTMEKLSREIYFAYKQRKDKKSLRNYYKNHYMNLISDEIKKECRRREMLRLEQNTHRMLMTMICYQIEERHANNLVDSLIMQEDSSSSEEEYIVPKASKKRKTKIPVFDWDEKFPLDNSDINSNYLEDIKYGFPENAEIDKEITDIDIEKLSKEISEKWCNVPESDFNEITLDKRNLEREHPEGYLEIFIGPMFSGKSSKILFKLSSMADQRFNCLYVNSTKDVRKTEAQDNFVTTHNSAYSKLSSKITTVKVSSLREVSVSDYDYIAVDELQFFDDEYTFDSIENWVSIYGKYVLVASLDGDCYRRKFGKVLDLIPFADEITKLTAYCDICRDNYGILKKAPFTARMTSDTTAELVGGTDIYKAMCRGCHDFHVDITSHY